ncbi:hypothetical protein A1Q2_01266 [Trichosporon asahii var. asahii CBS 8904]|uniref:Uncharacterized protein n=1 Tax=Trichosporon asahii var. asahii (strain CBS 8904) TaxID=1220162 RepID=K1VK02_TRIAC|nr:hypothetical protein A1Q2_01266 [Trichosporon asahii var. asahii CBS 8904]
MQDVKNALVEELEARIEQHGLPYDCSSALWPEKRPGLSCIISNDRLAFFITKNILDEFEEFDDHGETLNLSGCAHGTGSTVALMLDFIAGDRRADAPSNGWPDGWLQNTKDVEVVRAIMLAEELRNSNLRLRFWQVFRSQEADGRADYRRLFREAAIGGSARLSAYFAAKIWMNEWVKKQKIDVWHAFSVQQIAGIPAAYLWAFSHPVMGTTTGQRKLSRPLTPDTFANIWAIERKFNEALTSYYTAKTAYEEFDSSDEHSCDEHDS